MYTDDQLLQMLKASEQERTLALKHLFTDLKLRETVIHLIMQKGGQEYDAQDAYQKGFKTFYLAILDNKFEQRSNLRTFIIGICIRCWLDGLKKSFYTRTTMSDDLPTLDQAYEETPEVVLMSKERKAILIQVLTLLDKRCKEVILMGNQGYSAREIQAKLNLNDESMVRKIRYSCMAKLRDKLAKKPGLLQMLKSLNYE